MLNKEACYAFILFMIGTFIVMFINKQWNDMKKKTFQEVESPWAHTLKYKPHHNGSFNKYSSLHEIHDIIWKQIKILQEEGDCENKKILNCELKSHFSGFGSMVHRYAVCLQVAYGLGRIVFVRQKEYEHFGGLQRWLMPESSKCGYLKMKYYKYNDGCNTYDPQCYLNNNNELDNSYKVLDFNVEPTFPSPRHIPTTIPKSIEEVLIYNNVSYPWLWFASQFVGYLLLRPNKNFSRLVQNIFHDGKYQYPYVAMHIRHGDKLNLEAKYVQEGLFMRQAINVLNRTFKNEFKKRIYVASDDKLIKSKLNKYLPSNYKISMLPKRFRYTDSVKYYDGKDYPKECIQSMLLDLYFLAYSNYTICTYSSNIGRLVYEMKQVIPPYIASNKVISLDDPDMYYEWQGYSTMKLSFLPYYVVQNCWITIRANEDIINGNGYKIYRYKTGMLFSSVEKKVIGGDDTYSEVILRIDGIQSYIYANDAIKWPGHPKYYFYE